MKILLVTQNFYPELGSAANRLGVMFKLLHNLDEDTYVLTTNPTYPNKRLFNSYTYYDDPVLNELNKTNLYRLNTKVKKQNRSFFKRLIYFGEEFLRIRKFLNNHDSHYDYIYVTSPNIFMAWATLFFKKKDIKYALEIRDLWPDSANQIKGINIKWLMPLLRFLEKKMYNAADKIVINNLYFENHIRSKLKKEIPIHYLPNGIQKSEIVHTNKNKEFSVIYTGNVGHAQDVDQLIKIAKNLNKHKIPFTAIIYGAHAMQFRESTRHLEYVTLKQPMPRKDCLVEISKAHVALSVLKNSDVFLNVMPGKIIDAISMGTVPIANLGGQIENILTSHSIGFTHKDSSAEVMIENILKLKNNKKLYEEMSSNAIKYRNEHLIWEDNIQKLDNFLRESC